MDRLGFLLLRHKRHAQLFPLQFGELFNGGMFLQVGFYAFQQVHAQFAMGQLTATKTDGDFCFVTIHQKTDQVTQLDLVVAFVGARSELDFLDMDQLLLFLCSLQLFALLETELAVIHDTANWRIGGW